MDTHHRSWPPPWLVAPMRWLMLGLLVLAVVGPLVIALRDPSGTPPVSVHQSHVSASIMMAVAAIMGFAVSVVTADRCRWGRGSRRRAREVALGFLLVAVVVVLYAAGTLLSS